MTYKQIHDVVQDIERNLHHDLHPVEIAQAHFLSTSRLYKDFCTCTGYSVKEYIRQRRISNACALLRNSDYPLEYIASRSGLQTQQAFHKQFRKLVGMTPVEYRNSNSIYYFSPASSFFLHRTDDSPSIAVRVGIESIPAYVSRLYIDTQSDGIEGRALQNYLPSQGRIFGRNGPQSRSHYCYEIMTEVEGSPSEGLYATCIVPFDSAAANKAWNILYNDWLPCSMFEQSDAQYMEEIFFRSGKPTRLKLYLPVKKRTSNIIRIKDMGPYTFLTSRVHGANAEYTASSRVIEFVTASCPWLLQSTRRFFTSWNGDTVECGIELPVGHRIQPEAGLLIRTIPASTYAMLSGPCLGDTRLPSRHLNEWLLDNSIACKNDPPFAIYDSLDGHLDTSHIDMTVYQAVALGG